MTEKELDGRGAALDDFLRPYLYCCGYTQTFGHLHTSCRGLRSDLKRKTAEPIALASGCAVRTLQEFLRDHPWQHTQVRAQRQRDVGGQLAGLPDDGLGTVGLIDETSALKSGDKTPGVQRPYLGCVGKIDNGIEHTFRVGKSELGFTHYEGRNYTGLMRHQTLCLLRLSFVAGHTERLRGEKSRGDEGAGRQCLEPAEPAVAEAPAGNDPPRVQAGHQRRPPAAEPGSPRVPPAKTAA